MRIGLRRRLLILTVQLAIFAAVIAFWEVGSRVRLSEDRFLVDPFFFSRPSRILARDVEWMQDGTIARHVVVTLSEAAGAFVTGVVGGIVVGFVLGRSDFWARVFSPYIQVLNALPRLIFAPILILLLGLDERSKIALGFSLVFFIVFFNAFQGVRDVDRNVLDNARMLGASERQLTRHVLLPSAMTWILASLHTSVGFAMVGAVIGEYIGSARGIGYVIAQAEGNLDATGVWAGMVVLSVVVVVVEIVVTQIERHVVRWKPRGGTDLLAA
jgi:NitT/TauT family transport system permease protein